MQNGKWVLSFEDEWHLALANASSLIVSTEPWKPPDSKILVTSLTIDVPTSKQWLPLGDVCRSLPPMYSLIRESACSSVSAISQLFASKPFASHHPSKSSLIFGAEILFLISCWRGIFVFHLLVSIFHKRKPHVPWKAPPRSITFYLQATRNVSFLSKLIFSWKSLQVRFP